MSLAAIRKNIRLMTGYTPGEQPQGRQFIKLNTNENPYPPSPKVALAVTAALERLRLYPEPESQALSQAIAESFSDYILDSAQILPVNGSDEMLRLLFTSCIDPGDTCCYLSPTYSLYPTLAATVEAKIIEIPLNSDWSIPDQLPDLSRVKLMIIANPNAPTGRLESLDTISRLVRTAPHALIAIDEAYIDFAPDQSSAVALVKQFDNLVVCRTFSKSYSLAGLRVGFGIGSVAVMNELRKNRDSYNLDRLAQAGALAAWQDQDYMQANRGKIIRERKKLTAVLTSMGIDVSPSAANFILAHFGDKAYYYQQQLKERGILVRYWNLPKINEYIRITIGTAEELDSLVATISDIQKQSGDY